MVVVDIPLCPFRLLTGEGDSRKEGRLYTSSRRTNWTDDSALLPAGARPESHDAAKLSARGFRPAWLPLGSVWFAAA